MNSPFLFLGSSEGVRALLCPGLGGGDAQWGSMPAREEVADFASPPAGPGPLPLG